LASAATPDSAEVVVHLRVDQHEAQLEDGPGLPVSSAERLACDARVRATLADGRGNPLYLGRTRRLVSKTLLAALGFRDQHRCRFPGCTHTRRLQAHHIRHWPRGGRTEIDNLVLLCGFHHRLVHEHGYRSHGRGAELTFTTPSGLAIPPAGPPTTGKATTLNALNNQHGPVSDPDRLTPTWAGERLDPTPIPLRLLPPEATLAA
jgi:hypothetical protein